MEVIIIFCLKYVSESNLPLKLHYLNAFKNIGREKYKPGIPFKGIANLVKDTRQDTINCVKKYLEDQRKTKIRGDYEEFLDLILSFLVLL